VLLLAMIALLCAGCAGSAGQPTATSQPQALLDQADLGAAAVQSHATATRSATPTAQPSLSGLPTIRYQDLPSQAQDTIQLIEQDGPFPFERDGITFQNREGLLPNEPRGYYREYTVITPGSRDRGARRIVAGAEGELYYTDDHYESFREVIR
jgi:ribonuclease T1